eukprot:gene22227-26651_t
MATQHIVALIAILMAAHADAGSSSYASCCGGSASTGGNGCSQCKGNPNTNCYESGGGAHCYCTRWTGWNTGVPGFVCAGCLKGYKYNDATMTCERCAANEYQSSGADTCKEKHGVNSVSCRDWRGAAWHSPGNTLPACIEQPTCTFGEFISADSTVNRRTCHACPLGQYQDAEVHRTTSCKQCGANETSFNHTEASSTTTTTTDPSSLLCGQLGQPEYPCAVITNNDGEEEVNNCACYRGANCMVSTFSAFYGCENCCNYVSGCKIGNDPNNRCDYFGTESDHNPKKCNRGANHEVCGEGEIASGTCGSGCKCVRLTTLAPASTTTSSTKITPALKGTFVVNSGPCTASEDGRCVGRPDGYLPNEECTITVQGGGGRLDAGFFATDVADHVRFKGNTRGAPTTGFSVSGGVCTQPSGGGTWPNGASEGDFPWGNGPACPASQAPCSPVGESLTSGDTITWSSDGHDQGQDNCHA